MADAAPLIVVVAVVGLAALAYRRREGAARRIDVTFTRDDLRELGITPRRPALLLFTAPGCAPCTVARRVLDEAGGRRGIPVVTADVSDHHAIATSQHVYRAPTVFVVDVRGHAVARISGVPRHDELDSVMAATIDSVAA